MQILKHLLSTIILFFTFSVHSAPSDCIQLAEDGQVNCIKATSVFTRGQTAPKFDTFEGLVNEIVSILCSAYSSQYECYLQMQDSPTYPPVGRTLCGSYPTCNKYTYIDYNSSQNKVDVAVTVLNNTEPYYSTQHSQRTLVGFHIKNCPINTTAIHVGGGTIPYIVYCKPLLTGYEPTSCDNGCNANSGASSAGNH